MKKPALLAQPYAHWMADILARFEDGKPLTSDQLNFLMNHDKTLSSHALDLVIKYYLGSRKHDPDKSLAFTIPKEKINRIIAHELRDVVANLLQHNLSHIDLKMSIDQFLQFKAAGFNELIFWHGPQFLSRTFPFPNATPLVLYFQWGKLFGVVKLNTHVENFALEGNVLIYFEDMDLRSLNQCVLDYAKTNKINPTLTLQNNLNQSLQENSEQEQVQYFSPTPRPRIYEVNAKDKTD